MPLGRLYHASRTLVSYLSDVCIMPLGRLYHTSRTSVSCPSAVCDMGNCHFGKTCFAQNITIVRIAPKTYLVNFGAVSKLKCMGKIAILIPINDGISGHGCEDIAVSFHHFFPKSTNLDVEEDCLSCFCGHMYFYMTRGIHTFEIDTICYFVANVATTYLTHILHSFV